MANFSNEFPNFSTGFPNFSTGFPNLLTGFFNFSNEFFSVIFTGSYMNIWIWIKAVLFHFLEKKKLRLMSGLQSPDASTRYCNVTTQKHLRFWSLISWWCWWWIFSHNFAKGVWRLCASTKTLHRRWVWGGGRAWTKSKAWSRWRWWWQRHCGKGNHMNIVNETLNLLGVQTWYCIRTMSHILPRQPTLMLNNESESEKTVWKWKCKIAWK